MIKAEDFHKLIVDSGWSLCLTQTEQFRVCTYPAQHPLEIIVYGQLLRTGFCSGVGAEYGAVNKGLMSHSDARICRFACDVGCLQGGPWFENSLISLGAERHEFARIRQVQLSLLKLAVTL